MATEVTPIREIDTEPKCCGKPMLKMVMGQTVREMRYKYACRACGKQEDGALVSPRAEQAK